MPQQPVDPESDLAKAWVVYQRTEDFGTNKKWTLDIAPDVWPREQREKFVMGAMWGCFMAGFNAGQYIGGDAVPDEVEKERDGLSR